GSAAGWRGRCRPPRALPAGRRGGGGGGDLPPALAVDGGTVTIDKAAARRWIDSAVTLRVWAEWEDGGGFWLPSDRAHALSWLERVQGDVVDVEADKVGTVRLREPW